MSERTYVVFDVFAFDVVLEVVERRAGSVLELEHGHLEHVDLLGRIVAVVDLGPELGVHLQLDVVEVALTAHTRRVHVALGHVVARAHPVVAVHRVAQLLEAIAGAHGAVGELLALHLHRALVLQPLFLDGVVAVAHARLGLVRVQLELVPRIVDVLDTVGGRTPAH